MAVNLPDIGTLLPVNGIELGVAAANIRYEDRLDLAVMTFTTGSVAGGVFTQNSYRAAPVIVAEANCGSVRGLVVNSGNANAATGDVGLRDAERMCSLLGEHIGCSAQEVLPFSTGVIGEYLPMDRMADGIEIAFKASRPEGWNSTATAIMTTDTAPKGVSVEFDVDGHKIAATGIVKGSGMIRPDMATMLAFLGTDATISSDVAKQLAIDLAEHSFNRLTIDGDTSTNDAFVVVATGKATLPVVTDVNSRAYSKLREGLQPLVQELAIRTVRDGEGASKFVTVLVEGGRTERECLNVAYTVAHSPLVKTAIFAGDPNWGRFCMAIGRAGIADLDPYRVGLHLDEVCVATDGKIDPGYVEARAAEVMALNEFSVRIHLGRGTASAKVWTSDLSYEYVKINAEYRT
ncbi:MAG: bifunctional glutamate N-acetyltransferase/amino-acid acetyltransferase ArgJ [Gammaproteobacteria bacterium]|nr:bifunctional glutamate N-acetyltransferase/amino-acid acetyltransferase ArgJ [Gammaproteobacteria bacterium]